MKTTKNSCFGVVSGPYIYRKTAPKTGENSENGCFWAQNGGFLTENSGFGVVSEWIQYSIMWISCENHGFGVVSDPPYWPVL